MKKEASFPGVFSMKQKQDDTERERERETDLENQLLKMNYFMLVNICYLPINTHAL
jgi:hypothetical protein